MTKKSGSGLVKWILILGVLAVLGGGAWYYFSGRDDDAPQFTTATVSRGDIVQAVTATGTLNPVLNVTVGSQISGIILKLYADFNSPVTNGQIVAQLDPATYQSSVRSAEADLASAKAALELAQLNARRSEELSKAKLIAQADYDQSVATLHQAEAQVQIKQATLANANVNLARCTIYAPVDGTVISRAVDVGQTVAASLSAPTLFTIANDLSKMQIDSNVSEADIGTIEENQNVNFTVDAFPGRTFTGRVIQIRNLPITVQNVVTYDTVIEVNNADLKLKPGMTANVSVITAQRNNALKISNAAFRYKPADALTNKVIAAATPVAATNKTEVASASAEPPLTGNEPPEELQKRVSAMRERGDEIPPEIRAKLREYYQSGALQRPASGGGRRGGGDGSGSRNRSSQPVTRTVYILSQNASGEPALQAVRIKTGISDGITTEITEGLKEGDIIITGVKSTQTQAAVAPVGSSPFGGPSGGGGGQRRF